MKSKRQTMVAPPANMAELEPLLRYEFKDETLLEKALTHSSCMGSVSYERLEFIGDAALRLAISYDLYRTHPDFDPGRLTKLLITNVNKEKFACVAVHHDLYRFLRRHNCSPMDEKVRKFTEAIKKEGDKQRSETAPKVLSDIVESIAAAIYIDCGFNVNRMWKSLGRLVEVSGAISDHPVSMLNDFCQKNGKAVEFKHFKEGDEVVTIVYVDGKPIGYGCSKQRENSKLNAADDALNKLCPSSTDTVEAAVDDSVCIQALNEVDKEEGLPNNRWFKCSSVLFKLALLIVFISFLVNLNHE
ncbi:Ribonuclease 3-like protein 2 [Acorus calamus]|uniref:Ribonuclease 3-like protein 2 n=1 Tax=Acorus calamus TaxID=4465 RepID=A0AAV9DQ80_ACOCL|nr:Ribonuclease 3-like protein 2 [Acorus calamus]